MALPVLSRVGLDGLGGARLMILAERTIESFVRDRCTLAAAAIAYHALLSIFPLAIVLAWIASWFVSDTQAVSEVVDLVTDEVGLTPAATADLESQLESAVAATQPAGIIGLALLIWTASSLMTAVRRSINLAWGAGARRFFLFGKLIDVGIVAILGTFLAVSILLSFARDIVPDIILDRRDPTLLLAPFVASFLTLLLSYRFLPTVRTYVRDLWPAALGGAMAFEVLKFGFGVYLDLFSRNDVIYGSLGIVIGFMVFVYLSAALLLAGAELASETPRVRAGTYDEPAGERVSLTERIRRKLRVKRRNTSGGESPSSTDGRREPPAQS